MIFANIDLEKQRVNLLSIPRDLYHQNRKINSIYAYFGMNELTRRISSISGYHVEDYVLIDMYVFSDLIDLIGGIDVTLESDLVDPTYRTVDNGRVGTLYYPAGTHHLNGPQALRVARSRYTTSDYSRAERQHLILQGIRGKITKTIKANPQKAIQLAKILTKNTETNIDIDKILSYYSRFNDFEINSGYVLSGANVLASGGIPVDNQTSMFEDSCEEVDGEEICKRQYQMFVTLPRDNNWGNIKWYFRSVFEGN